MFSKSQLLYKLKLQSIFLAKSLNLPKSFGEERLARSIYNISNFDELCKELLLSNDEDIHTLLLEHQNLKYLLINEIDDVSLVENLHQEIEKMATRLESVTIINFTKIHLISILYKVFGLDNESKYIVSEENIKLYWQPCFNSLENKEFVIFSDFRINEIPFRLLATKTQLDELSLNHLNESFKKNIVQTDSTSFQHYEEKLQIDTHRKWLVNTCQCLSNLETDNDDELPYDYEINNEKYLVYGFPLSPHLSISDKDKCRNINIQLKNTEEKQIFILNIESDKLVVECIFLNKLEDDDYTFSTKNQWIKETLLSRNDACRFPLVFNNTYYLMFIRPYSDVDLLENAL